MLINRRSHFFTCSQRHNCFRRDYHRRSRQVDFTASLAGYYVTEQRRHLPTSFLADNNKKLSVQFLPDDGDGKRCEGCCIFSHGGPTEAI